MLFIIFYHRLIKSIDLIIDLLFLVLIYQCDFDMTH